MLRKCIAMDLGTANTLIHAQGQGIVLSEPSVVATDETSGRILAVGSEAKAYLGRTPQGIRAVRPLREGVIADFDMASALISSLLRKVIGGRTLMKPEVVICVPISITEVERRAVIEAGLLAGAHSVRLIEEPVAAAIGAGLPVYEPLGSMVVDVGGGTSDVAVIALGGMASARSIRVAGDAMNHTVQRQLQEQFQLVVGENMAERVKIAVGSLNEQPTPLFMTVSGKNAVTGAPHSVLVTDEPLREPLQGVAESILDAVRAVLEETPPELGGDLLRHGVLLTGGGSLLRGLDICIAEASGLPVRVDSDPLTTVLRGAGIALEQQDRYAELLRTE